MKKIIGLMICVAVMMLSGCASPLEQKIQDSRRILASLNTILNDGVKAIEKDKVAEYASKVLAKINNNLELLISDIDKNEKNYNLTPEDRMKWGTTLAKEFNEFYSTVGKIKSLVTPLFQTYNENSMERIEYNKFMKLLAKIS